MTKSKEINRKKMTKSKEINTEGPIKGPLGWDKLPVCRE